MNSTTITLASYLGNIQMQMIRILLTPAYAIGNVNNLVNILVFSQISLRSHICSRYFIGASMGHIFYLNMGCLPRVIWGWTQYDFGFISLPYCKARLYFVLDGLTISRYLFCLIAIDRWMITSRNTWLRQQSSSKISWRLIIVGVLFLIIVNIFIPIWYIYDKNLVCGPLTTDPMFVVFYTIYNTSLALVPLITLLIFSLLTLFNIRTTSNHQISATARLSINPEVSQRRSRFNKKDVQFMKLSLIQVAGYMLFNTLHAYNVIYNIITEHNIKTADQRTIEAFLFAVGLNLHYTYTTITFFLYTIASRTFRKACILLWKRWLHRLLYGTALPS